MTDTSESSGMDDVFRALFDPSRRSLLDSLNRNNGHPLRQLCAGLAMARQSVSKHIAVLDAAHLVTTQRRGREKLHVLNAAPINAAIADRWMHRYDRPRAEALADLRTALEQMPVSTVTTTGQVTSYIWTRCVEDKRARRLPLPEILPLQGVTREPGSPGSGTAFAKPCVTS